MDKAGGTKFTVDLGIGTFETVGTEVLLVFGTMIWGFDRRMEFALSHRFLLKNWLIVRPNFSLPEERTGDLLERIRMPII